ncbi:MAG: hypothetical protein AAGI72_06895 [Pseudomonadota bacterium]
MKRVPSWLVVTLLLGGLAGCGRHTHEIEKYVLLSADQTTPPSGDEVEPFRIRAVISGEVTQTRAADSVFRDSSGSLAGPYTLYVMTSYYGQTKEVCELHEITMRIGHRPKLTLHSRDELPLRIAFEPWLEHALSGRHDVVLGDRLPFQESDEVAVAVTFQAPGSDQLQTLHSVFVGQRSEVTRLKLEAIVKG